MTAVALYKLGSLPFAVVFAAMLSDEASIRLFVLTTVVVAVASVLIIPKLLVGLSMNRLVPAVAVTGSLLSVLLILIAAATMALSGQSVELVLIMALAVALATVLLGRKLARPITDDLRSVSVASHDLAEGEWDQQHFSAVTVEAQRLLADVETLRQSLVESEIQRERSEQARRAAVAALSHDLRTPLHGISAVADALEDNIGSPERNLRQLRLNIRTIDQLVTDLFLVSQAEAGTLRFECHSIDVTEVIEDVVEAISPLALSREVSLEVLVDSSIVATGDELALGRILRNLIDNAIRHTKPKGVVSVGADQGSDGEVLIEVRDEGPGLPDDAIDSDQEPTGGLRDHGGVGLGLTIATTLAQATSATVTAHPGPPGLVTIELPAPKPSRDRERKLVTIDD